MLPRRRWNNPARPPRQRRSRGAILAVFAIVLVVLLGLVGLVVDGGLLLATHRQAQNAADAAAMAAAMHRMRGYSSNDATSVARTFVTSYNGLAKATTAVNWPPATGPYAGMNGFVEVTVTTPMQTCFIHLLGVGRQQQAIARAVAGYEPRSAGEGVMVLDPDARPGLDVSGGGILRVAGRVVVNSEGGGVDENGAPIGNGNSGFAARAGQPNSVAGIYAMQVDVVGGVDTPSNFKPYDPADAKPLLARQLPEADPLLELITPTVGSGVDPTVRGDVNVTNQNVTGLSSDRGGLNHRAVAGEALPGTARTAVAGEVVLYPGVYHSLDITGGIVYLVPGIYVISPDKNVSNALKITGGTVTAERIMFYNTSVSYNPNTGSPDVNDREDKNPLPNTEYAGAFAINAAMKFSPIDTTKVNYAGLYSNSRAVSSDFNGMLFYQRRRHRATVSIVGDAATGMLSGTLYAKWANFQISGQGKYDAQFVCGSMSVTGQGNVTILAAGELRGRANQVYLVE